MGNITIETGTTELLCHIEDRVGVITLNKPDKKNVQKKHPVSQDLIYILHNLTRHLMLQQAVSLII